MMFRSGEIVEIRRNCGAWTTTPGYLTSYRGALERGSLVIVLGRNDFASNLRMMTMLEILHRDEVLIIEEWYLKACNPSAGVV